MKSRVLFLLALLAGSVNVLAQNLVPNGSFEEGIECPSFIGNVDAQCAHWFNSISYPSPFAFQKTPEWYHACGELNVFVPPNVAFGYQDPYDGEGFAGVIIFNNQDGVEESYREPIGVELIEPLIAGNTYQVEFSIVRMYSQPTTLSANNFGFKFTNTPTFSVDSLIIDNTAAFKIDTVISDTTNWLTVSAQFEADSAYSYVHFGNFYENDSTVFLADTDIGIYAYLALDAISITEVPTTSQEDLEKPNFRVFPNPSSNRLTVKSGLGIVEIRIFNSNGVLIEKFQGNDNLKIEIDIGRIKTGFYFLEISTPKFNYYEKIIKI